MFLEFSNLFRTPQPHVHLKKLRRNIRTAELVCRCQAHFDFRNRNGTRLDGNALFENALDPYMEENQK